MKSNQKIITLRSSRKSSLKRKSSIKRMKLLLKFGQWMNYRIRLWMLWWQCWKCILKKNRVFPEPSKPKKNEVMVALPLIVVAKMLLLNVMVSSNIRPCDLARKMHIKPQEVNRIIDLQHKTKLDTIDSAMRALGKSLQLTVV